MRRQYKDTSGFSWWQLVKAMLYLLDEYKTKYIALTLILIVVLFYDIIPPFIVGKIIDFFTKYESGMPLTPFYGYTAFIGISLAIVAIIRLSAKNALGNIQSKTAYFARVKGFERLLDFSIKWHDKESTGNKIQKIQNGTHALLDFQSLLSSDLYVQATAIIGVLVAYLFLSWPLFVFSLIFLAIFVLIQVSYYKRIVQLNDEYNLMCNTNMIMS